MRSLTLLLFFVSQVVFSQHDLCKTSNAYYFSIEDSCKMNPTRISLQRIKTIEEYLKSKYYGDSLILIYKYYFNETGLLIQVDNYNVYGKMNRAFYENDSAGCLSRIVFFPDKGVKTVKEINFENEQIQTKGYAIDTTFDSINRPIQIVDYQNENEIQRLVYSYQRKKTTLTILKNEDVIETRLQKYSKSGLLTKDVVDSRMSIKRISKREHVHNRPLRYSKRTYKYNGQQNMIKLCYFHNPLARSIRKNFIYNNDGRLTKELDKSRGGTKKMYLYKYLLYL